MLKFFKARKEMLNFTSSSIFRTFSGMAVSLIAIRLIGPEKLGLWHAALLLKPYVGFLQLGLTNGVSREIPFFMGQDKYEKVEDYAANAQFLTVLYTFTGLILTILLALFFANSIEDALVFITAGIFISTMFVDNYLSSTYRSASSFKDLGKVYYYSSFLSLFLLPLIYYFNFSGYLGLLFIHSLVTTGMLVYFRPLKVKSNFNKKIYFESIKVGFPLLCLDFLKTIPFTYPKLVILFFLSTTALGLTAPANAIMTAFSVLPAALAKYIAPKMTFQYGKDLNRIQLWETSKKIAKALFFMGIFGFLSLLLIPYGIRNFFPKYEGAIAIMMISVGIGFFRMFNIIVNVFSTLKAYRSSFKLSILRNISYLIFPISIYFLFDFSQLSKIFFGILIAEALNTGYMFYLIYMETHRKI